MIVISHHRSATLASRKRGELKAQYPGARVTLLSRRNRSGHYSASGRTFVWEVIEKPKKLNLVLHFDYGSTVSHLIHFQVHVEAPGDVTDEEAIRTVQEAATTGRYPKGWRERAIFWQRREDTTRHHVNGAKPLAKSLVRIGVQMGEGTVASRKSATKSNRRGRKGKAK